MKKFEELGISSELLRALEKLGITEPTEIQAKAIPHIMEGKDVLGESSTGSGKTLAFGTGVIEHTVPGKGLQSLILAPTRELAEQVKESLMKFSNLKRLNIVSIYGGVAMDPQVKGIRKADVVVATPGRLLDHVQRNTIDLSTIRILVLDEVDRMLDMGFIDDIKKIIKECPRERQTLFFSATMETRIKSLARLYMNKPAEVAVDNQVDPSKLKQVYYSVQRNEKLSLLINMLEKEETGLVMVFCNSRKTADFVTSNLKQNKIRAIAIHGGLSQNKRNRTMELFNNSKVSVLVCTDVAARGLHVDNVSHVYNYDIPADSKDYVHRIGRTARAGSEGMVVNLLCEYDHQNFRKVQSEYRDFNIEAMETPKLKRVTIKPVSERRDSRGGFSRGGSRGPRREGGRSGFSRDRRESGRSNEGGFRRRNLESSRGAYADDSSGPRRENSRGHGGPKKNFSRGRR